MKVSTVGKILSETERAYIAGFLDGDGAIMGCIERHKEKRFGFRVRVLVKITQTKKKDVVWLCNLTKLGYIRKNRRTFEWELRDQKAVKWFLGMISPFTHTKKEQVKLGLKILKSSGSSAKELYQKARLADTLSSFNVRSKKRRKNFAIMIKERVSRND
jgi:hypothetical protein